MGKNKNKLKYKMPKDAKQYQDESDNNIITETDEGGDILFPFVLHPTLKGQQILDEIKVRQNKKLDMLEGISPKTADLNSETEEVQFHYDRKELIDTLSAVVKQISDTGSYSKAEKLLRIHDKMIRDFIEFYVSSRIDLASEEFKEDAEDYHKCAKLLINIGKSFYEYSDIEALADHSYDGLISKYLSYGHQEPYGLIPKGKKNLEKADIKYPTLHNNMDKAYIIHINDPIPEGVKEKDSVEKFLQRCFNAAGLSGETEIEVELSPKIDGVSINGTIVGQVLKNPQTRGDSAESVVVRYMDSLRMSDDFNDKTFGIQYECFVTEEDRIAVSEYLKMATPYVSCRSAAAGIISRLASTEDDNLFEYLSFYPIMAEGLEGTYAEIMDYIQNFGVVPKDMPNRKTIKGDIDTLLKKISKQFQKYAELRNELSFAIDGMVITIVDDDYRKTIGRDGRTNKYQIALKFDPDSAIGIVSGVWLDSGAKGYRTIQVDLEDAVYLGGVRYDHVPVLSAELFKDLNLREGSTVMIRRIGDVIPAIKMIEEGSGKKIKLPSKCPSCGCEMVIKAKKLYCGNPLCKDNIVGRMANFFSELRMDDYGEGFADMVHTKFNVNSLSDLLIKLTPDVIKSSGVNSKKLENFREDFIDALNKTIDYKIIGAFGIPGIGPAKAKILLKELGFQKLIAYDCDLHMETIIRGIVGETTTKLACDFLESDVFKDDLREILPYIKLRTKVFDSQYIVGHSGIEPSREIETACWDAGWDMTDGKKFNILLVPRKDHNSTKVTIANKNNIPVVTEKELIDMIETRIKK